MPKPTAVRISLVAVTVTAASLLTTGCVTVGAGSPSAQQSAQQEATVTAGTTPHSTPAPSPARLTMAQARTEYSKISAPFNAAVTTVNTDAHEGTTWDKFRSDVLAVVAANKTWERKIGAVRWPLQIQPYVDAMLKTEVPGEIQCDQAMADAGSLQGAADVFSNNHACRGSTVNADKIRKLLNLPPTIGS